MKKNKFTNSHANSLRTFIKESFSGLISLICRGLILLSFSFSQIPPPQKNRKKKERAPRPGSSPFRSPLYRRRTGEASSRSNCCSTLPFKSFLKAGCFLTHPRAPNRQWAAKIFKEKKNGPDTTWLENFKKTSHSCCRSKKRSGMKHRFFFRLVKKGYPLYPCQRLQILHMCHAQNTKGFLRVFCFPKLSSSSTRFPRSFLHHDFGRFRRVLKNLALGKKTNGNNKFWENFPGGEISNLYISKLKTLIFSKASEPVGDFDGGSPKRWGIDNLKSVLMRFAPQESLFKGPKPLLLFHSLENVKPNFCWRLSCGGWIEKCFKQKHLNFTLVGYGVLLCSETSPLTWRVGDTTTGLLHHFSPQGVAGGMSQFNTNEKSRKSSTPLKN